MPDIRPWYQLVKYGLVYTGLQFFYKKIEVRGYENIPDGKPILVVPNHQNSFMDALLITTNYKRTMFYLTRAQAFKPKIVGTILTALNMLPVYRVRDGLKSVQKNKDIFEQSLIYLTKGWPILVFAEANHDLRRRVRPFSKGFTRIAFDAEVRHNWEFDLQVLPVGVNYSNHRFSRNNVRLVYGKPIPVSQYRELFEQDEREAANALKHDTYEALKPLVMHVAKLDQYPVHQMVLEELEPNLNVLTDPDLMNKRVEKLAPEANEQVIEEAIELRNLAEEEDVSIREAANIRKVKWWKLPLLPLYIFALINNLIPYYPIKHILTKVVKDRAFDASIKFLLGVIVFPLFYAIISLILWLVGVPLLYILIYFVGSLTTGAFFKTARDFFSIQKRKRKLRNFMKNKPENYQRFTTLLAKFKALRNRTLISE